MVTIAAAVREVALASGFLADGIEQGEFSEDEVRRLVNILAGLIRRVESWVE